VAIAVTPARIHQGADRNHGLGRIGKADLPLVFTHKTDLAEEARPPQPAPTTASHSPQRRDCSPAASTCRANWEAQVGRCLRLRGGHCRRGAMMLQADAGVAESNSEILACALVSRRRSVVDQYGPAQLLLQIASIRGSVPRTGN
jgi:hypothetical protein